MDLEYTKQRLEQAVGIEFRWETLASWSAPTTSYVEDGKIYFKVLQQSDRVIAIVADAERLSSSEIQLIEWIMDNERAAQPSATKPAAASDEDDRARLIGEWIAGRLDAGDLLSAWPDPTFLRSFQYDACLAILLDAEFKESGRFTYKELKKLIDTYFESDTVLIPLNEREWIVLASGSVLESAQDDGDFGESSEELLESIALALHEMIIEWLGGCKVSASGLLHAPTSLLGAIQSMRSAVMLGRLFHAEEAVYLPWKLHLERLLYSMDDREKKKFIEQLMKNAEHTTLDSEMMLTLQAFFQNECNISETSKALYIHRNTLLYRLDKFKQATGMDVRKFHDAVLVHMALLLYKVTKWD